MKICAVASLLLATCSQFAIGLTPSSRRSFLAVTASVVGSPLLPANAEEENVGTVIPYELRDRKNNKSAIIREDYWYMMGRTPPRLLSAPIQGDDPQFNAFGACQSSVGESNPCTYVSLKLRIPAYSKYGSSIAYGAKEYKKLGEVLRRIGGASADDAQWAEAISYLTVQERTPPPGIIDAELKMVLLATGLLTSPNFPGPGRELLVSRFYVNEAAFAHREMADAIRARDAARALRAWEFGRDSWNSFFQVVNPSISAKVGDKFDPIA